MKRIVVVGVVVAVVVIACTTVTVQVGRDNSNDDSIKAKRSIERKTVEVEKEPKE